MTTDHSSEYVCSGTSPTPRRYARTPKSGQAIFAAKIILQAEAAPHILHAKARAFKASGPSSALFASKTPQPDLIRSKQPAGLKICRRYTILREGVDAFLDSKREEVA